jgi:uncharacterized RmlC-like cupin family protein
MFQRRIKMAKKYARLRLSELPPEKRYRGFGKWPQTIVFTDGEIIKGSHHFAASWVTSLPRPVHGPHTHNDDELLVFLSSNPDDIRDLGCEVEMCIGPEMERHVFTESNLVYVPANLVHGPIRFRNLKRPFIFIQAVRAPRLTETPRAELVPVDQRDKMVFFSFDGKQSDQQVEEQYRKFRELADKLREAPGEEETIAAGKGGTKYGKYFFNELSPEKRQYKFGRLPQTLVFVDDDVIKGCHHFWALMIAPQPWPEHGPHSHENPEAMGTLGTDWNNPQVSGLEGGGDWMGTEMEYYAGTGKSGITFMPAGVVHGPVRYGKIKRTFIMFQCHYAPKLTEKSYKKLVDERERDTLVFFDLKGTETEAELDKQRAARKKPEDKR